MSRGAPAPSERRAPARSVLRAVLQLVGFLAGIAALGWCVAQALEPKNRKQFAHLGEAPASLLLLILGLTAASIVLNGVIFWATLLPVRRLRTADVLAVSALATFLAYLPFKLSAVARIVIHNRRDGVPLAVIGAWFAAVAAVLLAGLLPPAAASLWRGDRGIDGAWIAVAAGGIALLAAGLVVVSRTLRGERGIDRMHAMLDPLRLRPAQRFLRSRVWQHLHEGFTILSSPRVVAGTIGLRLADAAVQAARFVIAASILGQTLPWEQAVIISVTFFLIGVVSPTGMLGFREAGAAGMAGMLTFATSEQFAAVALLVGAAEAIVNLAGAAIGLAWLRPDRLLRGPKRGEEGRALSVPEAADQPS